jgi:hypothetical protein
MKFPPPALFEREFLGLEIKFSEKNANSLIFKAWDWKYFSFALSLLKTMMIPSYFNM